MATTTLFVLRAEGVNFAATLFDTQDISTLRGAGLALLELPGAVCRVLERHGVADPETVVAGASLFIATFHAPGDRGEAIRAAVEAALRCQGPNREPFQHLSFVVDVAPVGDDAPLRRVEPRNHARQLRQWTVPLPDFEPGHAGFDPLDRMRPALRPAAAEAGAEPALSASTRARRGFGRRMRQHFYARHARLTEEAAADLRFAGSFEDLVAAPPSSLAAAGEAGAAPLPLSLRSGMAVFYADGNGFRSLAEKVTPRVFSREMDALRTELLRDIVAWLRRGRDGACPAAFAAPSDPGPATLRFETLLWGGDEVLFVMPAWLGLAFSALFFSLTRDWRVGGERPTHAAGLVLCHFKTPIRLARDLAHGLADGIKEAARGNPVPVNALGIEVFEGQMPPMDGVAGFRASLYNTVEAADLPLAFPGDLLDDLLARLRGMTATDALSRSQLHRIAGAVRDAAGGLAGHEAGIRAMNLLETHRARMGHEGPLDVRLPRLPYLPPRSTALDLALILRLWDYAGPAAAPSLPAPSLPAPSLPAEGRP